MADFADTRTSTAGMGSLIGIALGSVSSGYANVSVGGEEISAQVARGLTLAAGDPVVVTRIGSVVVVICRLGVAAPAVVAEIETPPPPKPVTTTGKLVITPSYTGSYRDGRWRTDTDDTLQGNYGSYGNSTGAAFYGTKAQSLDGATVTSATIRVRRDRAGDFAAQTSTLWLVTETRKPSGAPTRTSSTTGPRLAVGATNNAFAIPDSWAQAMVDGTAGGLAIYDSNGSPYIRLAGKSAWSPAWTLTINWTRTV